MGPPAPEAKPAAQVVVALAATPVLRGPPAGFRIRPKSELWYFVPIKAIVRHGAMSAPGNGAERRVARE